MGYEIWDRYERALVNDFDTEEQALDHLRERIRPLTAEVAARWLDRLQLVRVFDDGHATEVISEGVDLLSRSADPEHQAVARALARLAREDGVI